MELNIYDIVKGLVITSKSVDLYKKLGQITFEVNRTANKILIKNAIEKLWNVKVADVRVMNVTGKTKSFGKKQFKSSDKKKAIVKLKDGFQIDISNMYENIGSMKAPAESGKQQ